MVIGMARELPTVGQVVHYVSYGTPGGEHVSACRAAIVTGVEPSGSDVSLAVLNPTGIFFNQQCPFGAVPTGGTWHWPARG